MTLGRLAKNALLLLLGCLPATVACAATAVSEYELKAAYIYNFALFTAWPADKPEDGSAMTFCFVGKSPLAASIDGLKVRKIRDRRIVVKEIAEPLEGRACHVLYLDADALTMMPDWLSAVRDTGTLTVSDVQDSAPSDTVINMAVEKGRLVFDVNLLSARRARLILSSKLLKLARGVN